MAPPAKKYHGRLLRTSSENALDQRRTTEKSGVALPGAVWTSWMPMIVT